MIVPLPVSHLDTAVWTSGTHLGVVALLDRSGRATSREWSL